MITHHKQNNLTLTSKSLTFFTASLLLSLLSLLYACDKQAQTPDKKESTLEHTTAIAPSKTWDLGESILTTAALSAKSFNTHIDEFLKSPSKEALILTQSAWHATAIDIEHFYALSRLSIAGAKEFNPLLEEQYNIAAWPIQPGYLDAYGEHIYSGIIFDIGSNIDEKTLRQQHGFTDNEDVALGIYAIEYLLFGEKNQQDPLAFQQINVLSEEKVKEGYHSKEELPTNRRRSLLRLQSKILTQDIAHLRTKWSEKHPDSLSSLFQKHSTESQNRLLVRITQNTITEQILAIAKQQKNARAQSPDVSTWKSEQLANKVSAQLEGLTKLMRSSTEPSLQHLSKPLMECVEKTRKAFHNKAPKKPQNTISSKPNMPQPNTSLANWKNVYNCIRGIAKKLEFNPKR